ncbi:MAG: hypothetical protein HZB85_04235 [Deltaproteobacteria bacterium]|nr:hypothetical protein [Deltaproteobacteria bacterium]
MKKIIIAAALAVFVFSEGRALAEDPALHGFIQANYSADMDTANPDGKRYKRLEERVQLRLDSSKASYRLFLKGDLLYDHLDDAADAKAREAFVDRTSENWDLRLGRQVITWGVGDLVFINDVFPKDYEAFFAGRPMEYLKKGVDGVKVGLYPEAVSIEAVVMPFFEPNNLPSSSRFWLYDPMPGVTNRVAEEPVSKPANTEVAIRAYRDVAGFDTSVYFYKGWYRTPSMRPDDPAAPSRITLFYPELYTYGLSLQKSAFNGVISMEAGYYDSQDDRNGRDPFVPNSQVKALAGYQRQLMDDLTAGVQYYGEYMRQYGAYEAARIQGFPKEPQYRQVASLRLTQLLLHQNMRLSWFSFYGITDRDYLLNPEARYNLTDDLWAAVGLMVFGGRSDTTQFGSQDKNDNAYLQARYEF